MPSERDIVKEARDAIRDPYLFERSGRDLLRELADEVVELRATILRLTQESYDDPEF